MKFPPRRPLLAFAITLALSLSLAWGEDAPVAADSPGDDLPVMEGAGLTVVREIPRAAQSKTITREDIAEIRPSDTTDLLAKAFGIGELRNGGYGNVSSVNVRGFGTGRVAVLVNGVAVNSPQSGDFDFNTVAVGSIEKIEVVYGGSDSRYSTSGASGGTINIVTSGKPENGMHVSGGVSNLSNLGSPYAKDLADTQNINLALGAGNGKSSWSLDGFANRAGNHFIYLNDAGDERRRSGNDVIDAGASGSLTFDLPSQSRLALGVRAYSADKDIPGAVGSTNPGNQKDLTVSESLLLDVKGAMGDRLDGELDVSHSFSRLDWKDLSSSSRHDLGVVSAVSRWGFYLNDRVQLAWGGDGRRSDLDSTNTGTVGRTDGGVYSTVDWNVAKFLTVTPSVRLALSGRETVPVPKLGFLWTLKDGVTVKNNFFRVYKLPNFNDLYWAGDSTAAGNPDLKSEDGLGTDAVVSWKKSGAYEAEASAYFSWHHNSIHWSSDSGILRPENSRDALLAGSDVRVTSDFSDVFSVSVSYSFLRTLVRTDLFGYADGKSIPYQPEHRLSIALRAVSGPVTYRLEPHYESARYTTVENVTKLAPFFTLDALASRKIGKSWEAWLDAKNIFAESYELMDGYPMPGASVTVGARFDYRTLK